MPEKGYIYVATGDAYLKEADQSACSLKKFNPDASVVLFSDEVYEGSGFDTYETINECHHNCYDKVPPLLNSPYEKTVFLDTDTYICGNLDEIWVLLDRYDLLVCHTAFRDPNPIKGLPHSFTEFNTGMIAFRKNDRTTTFFNEWLSNYEKMGFKADQPSFRQALWDCEDLRVYILPPEYNFRTIFPGFVGGGSEVKVIHGRHNDWEWIRRKLNKNSDPRVVLLSPLHRFGKQVIVIRKWSDLFKSFLKRLFLK